MRPQDIIRKKRDGLELTKEEVGFFVKGVATGEVADYQASAFLMAAFLKGMTHEETVALTKAMMASGTIFNLSDVSGIKIDKHSTGGVGDKTSIVLAPLLASMGVKVPMVAGRALGHTGGTLDKLESIPGFRTDLSMGEFMDTLTKLGVAMTGQSESFAPADRKLYALRDVTATVESIPLIASSIMSKKLAEDLDGLVLDVKVGAGAFMKDLDMARQLARTMVKIGKSLGVRTVALITNMDQPLGRTVGNALEIKECISLLKGKGAQDLQEVCLQLAVWMLNVSDAAAENVPVKSLNAFTFRNYKHEAMEFLERGDAFTRFTELIDAQGGDPEAAFKPAMLPTAANTKQILAPRAGFLRALDAHLVGEAAMLLGAGRMHVNDTIDPAAGIVLNKKQGEKVEAGEPLAIFHYNSDVALPEAEEAFLRALEIHDRDIAPRPLIVEAILEA